MARNDPTRQRSPDQDYQEQMFGQGANPKPTNARMKNQGSAPDKYATSGIERAMGAQADKIHKC